jgi:hypothetical protein
MHLTAEALASLGPDAPLVARDDDLLSAASTGVERLRKRKAGFLDVTTRQARDAMRLAGGTKVVPSRWRPRGFAPDAKFSCALDAIVVAANVSHVPLDAATEGRVYQSVMTQISTRGLSAKEMEKCASDIGLCLHFDKAIM